MVGPRTVLLKGLLEVLVLDSLGAEPKHGYGLIGELEDAVGVFPGKSQMYSLLTKLEDDGLIDSREEPGEGGRPRVVYSLTPAGRARLDAYRAVPEPFRLRLVRLWGAADAPDGEGSGVEAEHAERIADGWAVEALERLPATEVAMCPHAAIQIEREPRSGNWTIRIERADVAAHDDHGSCATCFLVQAAGRLLLSPSGGDR